jgi:RHS repeat-associated protein
MQPASAECPPHGSVVQGDRIDEDPTGLLNEGFRYRDLDTGVFITKDPAGFVDGPNLYAYVRQNPWTHFDPEGLEMEVTKKEQEPLQKMFGSDNVQFHQIKDKDLYTVEVSAKGYRHLADFIVATNGDKNYGTKLAQAIESKNYRYSGLNNFNLGAPGEYIGPKSDGNNSSGSRMLTVYAGQPIIIKNDPVPGQDPFPPDGREQIANMMAEEYAKNWAVLGLTEAGGEALGAGFRLLKLNKAITAIEDFLGGGGRIIKNSDGDTILMRGDKKIRFDVKDPHGDDPHFHVEQQTPSGKWQDAGPDHRYYFQEDGQ